MALWRDKDGAIWIDDYTGRTMYCVWDPTVPDDDYEMGLPMETREVIDMFGPLHRTSPWGWKSESDKLKEFHAD